MKYVLTIMMRRMVKLNLIEIKIQDLQFFLHFYFFCCAGRLHRNLIEIKKKITGIGLDVRGGMCYLCIVKLNTALTEVMFDGNNLNEINPGVFPGPSACVLWFILLNLFNYIVEKIFGLFLAYIGKMRYLCTIDNKCLTI